MEPLPILLDVNAFGELSNRIMDAFERGERTIPTSDAMQLLGHIHAWLTQERSNENIKIIEVDIDKVADGDVLVRVDDDAYRAVLIGQFRGRTRFGFQVWNPAAQSLDVVVDVPMTVKLLKFG